MKTLFCDICQKELVEPVATRTFYFIREYEVCEPCKDTIEAKLRPLLRNHFPFSPEWYEQQVMGMIEHGVSTGRA